MAPSAIDKQIGNPVWVDRDALRTDFTLAMSAMYKAEVPLYGDLVQIVSSINTDLIHQSSLDPKVLSLRYGDAQSARLDIERHGAIRLGTPHELSTIRRLFALIGLFPVGYYDLSAAGLPMHATCFRPSTEASLLKNPFRVFTSVLRPELLENQETKELAMELLSRRKIFSDNLMRLLDLGDIQGGSLTQEQGRELITEAIKTFGWQSTAAATHNEYSHLRSEHPILADIACFRSSHINHLTPRTLDINVAQDQMKAAGMQVKDRIEGPPARVCPILLRQTSFLAIEEPIKFIVEGGSPLLKGSHKARFGEIEERGAAVTPKGRKLYDELLENAMSQARAMTGDGVDLSPEAMDELVSRIFLAYPDDWDELRRNGLIFCTYRCTAKGLNTQLTLSKYNLEILVGSGILEAQPITYEDFLPLSAAGIFQSNLGSEGSPKEHVACPDEKGMEEALGAALEDSDELYTKMQNDSINECSSALHISIDV
ncbi:unnamed protein product [Clonostachys chloroleuca]|uniref:2-oxoadipate dioxygenase/decarboxylase n=1 Tax=Clonostachys chloroleuca TaxID=1926264 RepID=A0AA35Q9C2_9HYPO|nr:unnamed protein product [Clonostachys chloroleuca]